MGNRVVVMLALDNADKWENDAELGKKIAHASTKSYRSNTSIPIGDHGSFGEVVECVHGDTQTLAVLDGYTFFTPVAHDQYSSNDRGQFAVTLKLLRIAADKLGFRLVEKSK